MVATGATDVSDVRSTTPRSRSGFGSRELLDTHRQARMAIKVYHSGTPSAALAVLIYIVPNETMRCPLLLSRDSLMHYYSSSTSCPRERFCLNGSPTLTGLYMVDMIPAYGSSNPLDLFVASSQQMIPLTKYRDLEPGDILGTASLPILRILLDILIPDDAQVDIAPVAE